MLLTEKDVISSGNPQFDKIKELCHLSKNLYNAALYDVRQHYFSTDKYKTWQTQRKEFVADKNIDYVALNSHIAGEVLMQVGRTYFSFFRNKTTKRKKIPRYKPKDGFNVVSIPKLAISKKVINLDNGLFQHTLCPKKENISIVSTKEKLHHVKIVYNEIYDVITIYKTYEVADVEKIENDNLAAIDIGLNNIVTLITNIGTRPLLYNGKPIKSINQYYNKRLAKLQSQLPKGQFISKSIKKLTFKRNNKINHELHCISKAVVEYCSSQQISKIVIGQNKDWKDGINIGKKNNQKFVMIPHARLIQMIEYKARMVGITVIVTEESYTSKCSFFDQEKICKHQKYLGKRTKRGLFIDSKGKKWNADVNGAFNILRKVASDEICYSNFQLVEGFAGNPIRCNIAG